MFCLKQWNDSARAASTAGGESAVGKASASALSWQGSRYVREANSESEGADMMEVIKAMEFKKH